MENKRRKGEEKKGRKSRRREGETENEGKMY